jgi:hypothetical protein
MKNDVNPRGRRIINFGLSTNSCRTNLSIEKRANDDDDRRMLRRRLAKEVDIDLYSCVNNGRHFFLDITFHEIKSKPPPGSRKGGGGNWVTHRQAEVRPYAPVWTRDRCRFMTVYFVLR